MTTFNPLATMRANDRGNVAILAAFAMIPLAVASLGAVDLTRAYATRVELQDALDAAALAAGRSSTSDETKLQAMGERILSQNLSGARDFTLGASSFKFGPKGEIVAQASATYAPMLGLGDGTKEVTVSTEVKRANSMLEIAMVLDNTGSMATDDKIDDLRKAAKNFVTAMENASKQSSTPNSIKIALIPFSNTVRLDAATYRTATWMDQTGASPINNEIFTTAEGVSQTGNRWTYFDEIDDWRGCVEMRKAPYDIQDTPPDTDEPATLFTPMFAPDEDDADDDAVNDYLYDNDDLPTWWARQGDIAKYKSNKIRNKNRIGADLGPNAGCGLQKLQRLTTDFSGLRTRIGAMKAVGETNIPNGLLWGWLTLSPKAPFSDGVAYLEPKYKKIVVLMTDGDNMMSRRSTNNRSTYSAAGFVWQGRVLQADGTPLKTLSSSEETRTAALDDRLKKLCTNMKASNVGIVIYAVGVGVSTSSKALLKNCATDADHYIDVNSGSGLNSAFQSIAGQISQLHLSK